MWVVDLLVVLVLLLVLAGAIWTVLSVYICDNHTCKAFTKAKHAGDVGSDDYNRTLVSSIFTDGMWPLAFIGAVIGAFFSLWLTGGCMTIVRYVILLLIWFFVIYFVFSFTIHHYLDPILESIDGNARISHWSKIDSSISLTPLSQQFKDEMTEKESNSLSESYEKHSSINLSSGIEEEQNSLLSQKDVDQSSDLSQVLEEEKQNVEEAII